MLPPNLYNRENVERLRYAQLAATGVAVVICGYLVITSLIGVQGTWSAERMLRRAKTEAAGLSREAARERRLEAKLSPPSDSGVDRFAVQFAEWAANREIRVESFVPEGTPTPTEITLDGSRVGLWNANKVRVKGQGGYAELMSLLDEFRNPCMPVQLDSFSLQSACAGDKTLVSFDLVLTVYENKNGAG
jgi:hypothetical protein